MPTPTKIAILQIDIDNAIKTRRTYKEEIRERGLLGRRSSVGTPSEFCPLAQALKRLFNTVKVSCGLEDAEVDDRRFIIPKEVREQVINPFDSDQPVEPCEITIFER